MGMLEIQRSINAEPVRVWEALVAPNDLNRWLTSEMINDIRVGGTYRDGNGDVGTYLIVEQPRHLRFTWDNANHCPGTVVDFLVEKKDGSTSLVLSHFGLSSESDREHMREGWDHALDLLKSYLEI
jgi:uncharacterized protein YndB with AHSA1/START domain